MKDEKKRALWFITVNAFLFISTIIVTYVTLSFGTVASQVDTSVKESWFYIATYTVQSNILMGIVALIAMIFGIKNLKNHQSSPRFLTVLYLVASSAVMLTALTVIFFLAPLRASTGRNYFEMMMGPMFLFHFFNPFLSALVIIFLAPKTKLTKKDCLFSLLPPLIYSVPYILNVVILKTWYDFYNFTFGGNNWVILPVFLVISGVTFGIATLLAFLHNKQSQNSN